MEASANTEIEQLRRHIAGIGKELEALNNHKESLYREKTNLDALLSNTISEANVLKTKKKALDEDIKKKKLLRTTLNKELKDVATKAKAARAAAPVNAKVKKTLPPEVIKKQIEAMQYAIETEGLSFEKEKQYMDKIKQLKSQLSEINAIEGGKKEIRGEIAAKKSQADQMHVEVQQLATESTKSFDDLTKKAKIIIDAKAKRSEMQAKLKDLKAKIDAKNVELSEALSRWLEVAKDLPPEVPIETFSEADVINKFKNSKKLTKDDLLKLQRLATR